MHNDLIIEDRRTNVKFKDIRVGRFFDHFGQIYQKIADYDQSEKRAFNKAVHLRSGLTYCFDDDSEMSIVDVRLIIE